MSFSRFKTIDKLQIRIFGYSLETRHSYIIGIAKMLF